VGASFGQHNAAAQMYVEVRSGFAILTVMKRRTCGESHLVFLESIMGQIFTYDLDLKVSWT